MSDLTFYFDPACPWAWRAFLWVRELRKVQDVSVDWRLFSLKEINRDPLLPDEGFLAEPALRVLALVRRTAGNDAVESLYLTLGHARHSRRESLGEASVIEAALGEAGLDPALLKQALDDPATLDEVAADHRFSVSEYNAFGVPWLVLGDRPYGFYGPVISEVPEGDAAGELWHHTQWFLSQRYFYEMKRERG